MVLVIDTSFLSALALVEDGRSLAEDVAASSRARDLPARVRGLVAAGDLSGVLVALGPGSFTGLRVGVSFGVGLAMGLGIPLLGLGSLAIQAARAPEPATALIDAGRGRVYWQRPGCEPRHGDPEELPRDLPAVGWLAPATAAAVRAAGVRLLDEGELRGLAGAAAGLVERARRLGYDTVKLEYMQSFGPVRE